MTYADQSWGQRVGTLGDIAEGIFEEVAPLGAFIRYGLNRPPFKVANLNDMQRNTPDYLCGTGDFVEVMGCGRDNVVKLKPDKWEAQLAWDRKVGPVKFFLWNSNHGEWALISTAEMRALVTKAKRKGVQSFNDGNEYLPIDWAWIGSVFPYVRN